MQTIALNPSPQLRAIAKNEGKTITTLYATALDYQHLSNHHLSGCLGSELTIEKAREHLMRNVKFYADMPDVLITSARIEAICQACWGKGHVLKKRGFGKRVCTDCKGRNSVVCLETWVNMPKE